MSSMYQKWHIPKGWRIYLDWILILLILFFAFVAIILVPALLTASGPDSVPFTLHSILNANYGIDPLGLKYFQVKSDIIAQVIEDQNGSMPGDGAGNPLPPGTPTVDALQPFSTLAPTDGAINPTASNKPSPTYLANFTPRVTDRSTPGVEITQQVSQTPGSSSKTATPTHPVATRRPTSTSTDRSPGPTSAPTRTTAPTSTTASPAHTSEPTELPTSTPPLPTRTPVPTDPPPTNTPRPTRPPDPYPPPPAPTVPPPPPPPQPTPYP